MPRLDCGSKRFTRTCKIGQECYCLLSFVVILEFVCAHEAPIQCFGRYINIRRAQLTNTFCCIVKTAVRERLHICNDRLLCLPLSTCKSSGFEVHRYMSLHAGIAKQT